MKKEVIRLSLIALMVFLIFSVLGYVHAFKYPDAANNLLMTAIEEMDFLFNFGSVQLFIFIFVNNTVKSLIMMLLGLAFGVMPLIFMGLNGYLLGGVVSLLGTDLGIKSVLLGVLPHGIIEISAAAIASGFGLFLGLSVIRKKSKQEIISIIKISLKFFLKFILPALLIASAIEVYLIPYIV